MSDFLDNIFDFDVQAEGNGLSVFETPTGSGIEFFNPKPEGAKKYVATVRLLMNLASPKDSIVHKRLHWLKDAQGNFSCDSPYSNCPVSKVYFTLDKSNVPAHKALAKELKINKQYVVYVQIVNDVTTPENVGKILPWRMPVDVYKKVDAWMNPTPEDIAGGKTAKSFFNPINSVNLILSVYNKTDNGSSGTFRGYDVELTDATSITIDGKKLENTKEDQELFKAHLAEHQTINLVEKFSYTEPDAQLKARVKALLKNQFGQDVSSFWQDVEPATASAPDNGTPSIVGDAQTTAGQSATVVDSTANTTATTTAETSQPAQGTEEDLDAILEGIG